MVTLNKAGVGLAGSRLGGRCIGAGAPMHWIYRGTIRWVSIYIGAPAPIHRSPKNLYTGYDML